MAKDKAYHNFPWGQAKASVCRRFITLLRKQLIRCGVSWAVVDHCASMALLELLDKRPWLSRTLVYGNWWKWSKTGGKRFWTFPNERYPSKKGDVMIFLQYPHQPYPNWTLISVNPIICTNVALSCRRTLLPYIIIVQTCGKRRDLPKFVDVLSVNLGFSRLLM